MSRATLHWLLEARKKAAAIRTARLACPKCGNKWALCHVTNGSMLLGVLCAVCPYNAINPRLTKQKDEPAPAKA